MKVVSYMAYSAEVVDFDNRMQGYHIALSKTRTNFNNNIQTNKLDENTKIVNLNMYNAYNKLADNLISYIDSGKLTDEEAKHLIEIIGRDQTSSISNSESFINLMTDLKGLQDLEDKRAVYDELYYALVNSSQLSDGLASTGNQRILNNNDSNKAS